MNVREYFERAFPGHVYEQRRDPADLESMPLDSTCGQDCKGAIDAATTFANHVRMIHGAAGKGAEQLCRIRNITVNLCGVMICG